MCRQGIRRRLRQETRGSEGNLCPLTTQLRKYSPVRLRGGYFFILSYPSVVQIFIGFLLSGLPICITPCNLITQIPTRLDTGGLLFYSLLSVRCTNLYWLPIIWITPFNPIMQIPPCRCGGILYTFFSFRRSTLYIFLLPLYGDSWGFPIISTAQNNLVP